MSKSEPRPIDAILLDWEEEANATIQNDQHYADALSPSPIGDSFDPHEVLRVVEALRALKPALAEAVRIIEAYQAKMWDEYNDFSISGFNFIKKWKECHEQE
jgi:hypothetical protein